MTAPRPDADVIAAWEERAAIHEYDAGFLRGAAEEAAATEFEGRERVVVELHRVRLATAREAKQPRLFR